MTAQRIAAIIARAGETVTLRRVTGTSSQTNTDVTVKASIRGYRPDELAGPIEQGDREVIISNAEIAAASWPGPPRRNDKIIRDGKVLNVEAAETRNYREEAAMHVLRVRG